MTIRYWTAAEREMMRRLYPDTLTADLARQLGRSAAKVYQCAQRMGLKKSQAYMSGPHACRLRSGDDTGIEHRFKPGHQTWNKGKKGSTGTHENTRANHFKLGAISGRAAKLEMPVGTLRVNRDGYLDRKINCIPGPSSKRWRAVHRLVWEAAHGPVPAGHIVVFLPGRKTTDPELITLDALELITRVENMRRNTLHNMPPELARLVQLRGVLNRKINQRLKKDEKKT